MSQKALPFKCTFVIPRQLCKWVFNYNITARLVTRHGSEIFRETWKHSSKETVLIDKERKCVKKLTTSTSQLGHPNSALAWHSQKWVSLKVNFGTALWHYYINFSMSFAYTKETLYFWFHKRHNYQVISIELFVAIKLDLRVLIILKDEKVISAGRLKYFENENHNRGLCRRIEFVLVRMHSNFCR